MALYFLKYDLRKQSGYKALSDELVSFNAVRMLDSLWCFRRINTNAPALRDHFRQFLDVDDGLVISEVTQWAVHNSKGMPSHLK